MAKIEYINIRGNRERCVNLSYSVGAGGQNAKSDVFLIQLMLSMLLGNMSNRGGDIGSNLEYIVPLTGSYDALTAHQVNVFQSTRRRHLLSADGIIHPADYKNRVIKDTTGPLMMITYLHLMLRRAELRQGWDYVSVIGIHFGFKHFGEMVFSHNPSEIFSPFAIDNNPFMQKR